jgi:hypothetical protein
VADEPVVVTNLLPVKAGDRPEDKTKGIVFLVMLVTVTQKDAVNAKG